MSVAPIARAIKKPNFSTHTVSPEEKQQILARINELNRELMEALNNVDTSLSQQLQAEIESTTQRFQQVNEELSNLNTEIGKTNTNLSQINTQLTQSIANLDTKTATNLATLRKDSEDADAAQAQNLSDAIDDYNNKISELTSNMNSYIGTNNARVGDVEDELAAYKVSNNKALNDYKTANNLRVKTLEDNFEAFKTSITQQLNQVNTNLTNAINQVASDLAEYEASNNSRVKDVEDDLAAYKSSNNGALNNYKTSNDSRVKAIEDDLAEFKTTITGQLNTATTNLQKNIDSVNAALNSYIATNNALVTAIEQKIDDYIASNNQALSSYITTNNARVKAVEDDLASHKTSSQQALNSAKTELQGNIDGVNTELTDYKAANDSRVEDVEEDLSNYKSSNNQALSSYKASNDARVKNVEDDLSSHKTSSAQALQSTKTELQGNINSTNSALNTYKSSNDQRVKDVEDDLSSYKSTNNQALSSYQSTNNSRVKAVEDDLANHKTTSSNALTTEVNKLTQSINSVSSSFNSYKTSNNARVKDVEDDIAVHLAASNPHGITPAMIGALTQAIADARYCRLTGMTMQGDINMGQRKISWSANTDGAEIRFDNTGDGDLDSSLHMLVMDNGNEFFKWSTRNANSVGGDETEWMTLKADGLRIKGGLVFHENHLPTTSELGIRNNTENDQRYHYKDAKVSTTTLADKVKVNASTSTSFYNMLWNSGDTLYNSDGLTIRPSDGYTRVKHGLLGGNFLSHNTVGQLAVANTAKRSAGLYGLYDAAKTAQIWSMGTGYKIDDNGANFGNLYGLAYKHTNNPEQGTMGAGHQMVWCQNGVVYASIGNDIWAKNNIYAKGNVSGFSDKRLKKNFEVIENALDKVLSLTGLTYDRIDLDDERQAGLIAQEVQKVLPEVVSQYGKYLTISYGNFVALLVNAIKELAERQGLEIPSKDSEE